MTSATVEALTPVCQRYADDIDLYTFGVGMQDPAGAAEGILRARVRGERGLRPAAHDAIDRRKLRPLATAMRSTDRALTAVEVAATYGSGVAAALARYAEAARRENGIADRVGVGGCLAAPA